MTMSRQRLGVVLAAEIVGDLGQVVNRIWAVVAAGNRALEGLLGFAQFSQAVIDPAEGGKGLGGLGIELMFSVA